MPTEELDPDRFTIRQLDAMIALEKVLKRCAKLGIVLVAYSAGPQSVDVYALRSEEYKVIAGDQLEQIAIGEPVATYGVLQDVGGI